MAKNLEVRIVKLEDGQQSLVDMLGKMDAKLDGLDAKIDGMDHIVRGNGSPGMMTQLELHSQSIKELQRARKSWKDFMVLIISGGVVAALAELFHHVIP